jgi:hypothetical protein
MILTSPLTPVSCPATLLVCLTGMIHAWEGVRKSSKSVIVWLVSDFVVFDAESNSDDTYQSS